MTIQDLKKTSFTEPLRFESFKGEDILEVFHQENFPSWANKFALVFNGKFEFFKTFHGLENRSEKLIQKFNLESNE